MKVQGAMHKGVEWVGPDTPVTELAKLMRQHDVGSIPIGENDKLIGMVTDRDIVCKGLAQNGFDPCRATARDVMTEGIHCCREDDDLAKAVRHMEQLKVRRLPVSNRMVGILSWATSAMQRPPIACPNGSRVFRPITTKMRGYHPRAEALVPAGTTGLRHGRALHVYLVSIADEIRHARHEAGHDVCEDGAPLECLGCQSEERLRCARYGVMPSRASSSARSLSS